jgi:BirA family biotin operon repressor/biotin-[acetyl-CoA-carboxylase] ligase
VLPLAGTRLLGHQIYRYLETTASTNTDARALGEAGAPHGSLVVAETQTAGRGRHERRWLSPRGLGIYATLLLRPPGLPVSEFPLLTLLAAVAAVEAISRTVPALGPSIKWPNDILIDGRKVGGILAEMPDGAAAVPCILLGIGINVNTPADMLPDRPIYPASSLALEAGHTVSRAALLAAWLQRVEYWLERLEHGQSECLLARWTECASMTGRRVSVTQQTDVRQGIVCGIAADGALLLRTDDGQTLRILSGDLRF